MNYYIYIKQHNQTKLKYLGKTIQNPYKYKGSGKYWKRHIKIHGNDVSTYIVGTYKTKKELREEGLFYSKLWDIVESDEWANLQPEEGTGAASGQYNPSKRPEVKEKQGQTWRGKKFSKEHCQKISQTRIELETTKGKKNPFFGKKHTEKSRQQIAIFRLGKSLSEEAKHKLAKNYIVTNLQGIDISVRNLNEFCQKNNLRQASMWRVANNQQKQHKGWKCRYQ